MTFHFYQKQKRSSTSTGKHTHWFWFQATFPYGDTMFTRSSHFVLYWPHMIFNLDNKEHLSFTYQALPLLTVWSSNKIQLWDIFSTRVSWSFEIKWPSWKAIQIINLTIIYQCSILVQAPELWPSQNKWSLVTDVTSLKLRQQLMNEASSLIDFYTSSYCINFWLAISKEWKVIFKHPTWRSKTRSFNDPSCPALKKHVQSPPFSESTFANTNG